MPMIIPGVAYYDCGDQAYEAETTYYLDFQIKSALFSLHKLEDHKTIDDSGFGTIAQYYHYYTDHLLFSLGQISERFRIASNVPDNEKEYYERRKTNRLNYQFDEKNFPLLSNKNFRNTVEHIDEHNIDVINNCKAVGGFNYIDESTPQELANKLLMKRQNHIYTVDLSGMKLYITRKGNELTLDLKQLKNELNQLMNNVKDFSHYIKTI